MQIPFSIYLGWISVALIANVTDVLYDLNWSGWGIAPQIWAVIMLVAALIIAGLITWRRGDIAYLLVLLWAFVGIAVKQAGVAPVDTAAWIASAVIGVYILIAAFRKRELIPV